MTTSRCLVIAILIMAFAAAIDAFAQQAASPQQTEIARKLAEIRARLADDPRVKEAKSAVEAADKAVEEKLARDPSIAEARRAESAARDAVGKAQQAAADGHPRVQELRRTLEAARTRAGELDLQRRLEEMRAEHLRQAARNKPELRELWTRSHFHPHAAEALAADPRLAAARKAFDEANAAMESKMKDLPEFRTREQARKALDEAVAVSQAAKDAAAARRSLDEKVAADDGVAAQVGKVKTAGEAQAAHQKTIEEIEKRIRDAAAEAAAQEPRVAEAMRGVVAAQERVRKTIEDRVATEHKAREAARAAWREKLDTVIAERPEAQALMKEMRSLEERLKQVREQMDELRRPVSQAR